MINTYPTTHLPDNEEDRRMKCLFMKSRNNNVEWNHCKSDPFHTTHKVGYPGFTENNDDDVRIINRPWTTVFDRLFKTGKFLNNLFTQIHTAMTW